MENVAEIKLVKGDFTAAEAKEILFPLITSKIRFHQLEVFSNRERNTGNIEYSEKRIVELEDAKEVIASRISEALNSNRKIKINGTIEIEILD
uniref:hypothetical protein n=1 Tax=Flavobacterium sp. TaxID=239 RepID=UPI004049FBAD